MKNYEETILSTHSVINRQGNLQYTEKTAGKNYLKTMTTMQEYPEEFVV